VATGACLLIFVRALDQTPADTQPDGAGRTGYVSPLDDEHLDGARSPMLEIANAIVRLYKEAFGRGPTKARAMLAGPDTLVVILENSLTVAERNLSRLGEHERVREARLCFQHQLEHQFRSTVERILGRRTVAFVSGIDPRCDVAVELFTLEREPQTAPAGVVAPSS
jgi:uncharacterized protein YbcI